MILQALGLTLALGFFVALPGWLLVKALFPREGSIGGIERVFLTIAGGILVTMSVGIILGFLPHGDHRGALQSLATRGMPNVELAMIGVCAALFAVGVRRGAFPSFAARYPRLAGAWTKPSQAADQQP